MAAQWPLALLAWYDAHRRDLPWRRERDPYRIWVAEVMLQQTRVDTVIPYYQRWLERFPTLTALAAAPEEEVLRHWAGLGYYARARHLHRAAQRVVAEHGGTIPRDPAAFAALPGVGEYTAGAVLSIAYGLALPAVDGNVLRVMARIWALDQDIAHPTTRRLVAQRLAPLIPPDRPGDFNQALMDLGATLCIPGRPRCEVCPVAAWCAARAAGREAELPVRAPRRPPAPVQVVAGVVRDGAGRVLVVRRPGRGLLARMWSFPTYEVAPGQAPEEALAEGIAREFGLAVAVGGVVARVDHTFSHRRWDLLALACRLQGPPASAAREGGGRYRLAAGAVAAATGAPAPGGPGTVQWVTPAHLAQVPLPAAYRKVAAALAPSDPWEENEA